MNEPNNIHRDLYVGMVAEEMAQSGYYGEDVTRHGFLANGALHSFAEEEECCEAYLLALAAGADVSRMLTLHKRCPKKRAAREKTTQALDAELQQTLDVEPLPFVRKRVDLRPLAAYTKNLAKPRSRAQEAAIVGIMTLPTFAMAQSEREAVLDVKKHFNPPSSGRRFFGFYEKHGDSWTPVTNGALPAILAKWCAAAGERPVTPILPMHLASTKPVYQLRTEFDALLAETMDANYLALCDALYASLSD